MSAPAQSSRIAVLRPIVRACLVLACLALVWSVIQLDPWQRTAESRELRPDRTPWTAVNPIGVNTFLAREVEDWKRDKTLDMVAAMGAGWIKEHFAWRDIEPEDDVYWDAKYQQDSWAKYDSIIDAAEKRGLRVIARIDQTPAWARAIGSDPTAPPSDPDDFGEFIAEFVERYRGRVQFIQVWNEPNLAVEWGGEIDPEQYAELLRVASERARAADPDVVILSAPMAMTTENSERAMSDLDYWQALYDAGAGPYFDIASANAYGLDSRFDAPPDPSRLNVRRVELLRDLMERNGDGAKPIWLNEYGWNAAPGDFPADQLIWSRVTERQQAEWTVGGIEFATEEWPWFGVANVWYFRHVGSVSPGTPDHYFRMVDVEFTPRDVYRAVSELGSDLTVAEAGTYNDLEAPLRAFGSWPVVKHPLSTGGEFLRGDTGSRLAVTFRGSKLELQLGPGQQATEVKISLVSDRLTAPLEPDAGGRVTPVEAGAGHAMMFEESETTAPRLRTAIIEVSGDAPLLVDGFTVESARSLRNVWISVVILLGLVAADFGIRRKSSR